jgi:dihydrodipicolinate synthase/N-acetylneuraminate lyase
MYGVGLPVGCVLEMCKAVRNIVGWKMTYNYTGWKIVGEALRSLDHHVALLGAPSDLWHVFLMMEMFDGTVNGGMNYSMEPSIDHIQAWKRNDLAEARRIWNAGLGKLNDYVYADYARLHIRYKIGAWLRGNVPEPFMRPPQPRPKKEEVTQMAALLKQCGLNVIPASEIKKVTAKL